MSKSLRHARGRAWAYLPPRIPEERVRDLGNSLRLPGRVVQTRTGEVAGANVPNKDPAFEDIRRCLRSGIGRYALIDDPMISREDFAEGEIVKHVYDRDEVDLYLDSERSLADISATLGLPPSWLLTGVLTVLPGEVCWPGVGRDMGDQELAAIVRQVCVGAWDGEAIAFWAPEDEGSEPVAPVLRR